MTDSNQETPPPHAQLIQMAMRHWVSHIVYAAANSTLPIASRTGQWTPINLADLRKRTHLRFIV